MADLCCFQVSDILWLSRPSESTRPCLREGHCSSRGGDIQHHIPCTEKHWEERATALSTGEAAGHHGAGLVELCQVVLMDSGWGEQGQGPSVGKLWDLLAARTNSLWSLYVMTGSDRFLQQPERKLSCAGHCDPLMTHLGWMGKLAHPSVPPSPSGISLCSQYQ